MKMTPVVKLFAALAILGASANAQVKVFVKLIPYQGDPTPAPTGGSPAKRGWIEVTGLSFNVEQTLNIGSQSTGAGAGKIVFNPLSFTLASTVPGLDAKLLTAAASGTPYKEMLIEVDKNGEVEQLFTLKLVAVKTVAWLQDPAGDSVKTQLSIVYGGLFVGTQQTQGAGWNRVNNTSMPQDFVIR